jgi:hypothetical protein
MIEAVRHVRSFKPGQRVVKFPKCFLSPNNLSSPGRFYFARAEAEGV